MKAFAAIAATSLLAAASVLFCLGSASQSGEAPEAFNSDAPAFVNASP